MRKLSGLNRHHTELVLSAEIVSFYQTFVKLVARKYPIYSFDVIKDFYGGSNPKKQLESSTDLLYLRYNFS